MPKKLSEILKEVFGARLDEEVEVDITDKKESALEEKEETKKVNDDKGEDLDNTPDKKEAKNGVDEEAKGETMESTKIFEDGWYDTTSGKINFDKIKNVEALEAIKTLSSVYQAEKEQRLISDSLNETLKEYSLTVSQDTFKKVLDTSGVKIDKEGKVVGIKEAIESLKTNEPGFFKDKEKESSPLNEGFNPVEKPTATTEDELVNLAYCQ